MNKPNKQNEISKQFLDGSDLQDREDEVLEDASKKLGFKPTKLVRRSSWWTSKEIGAFHYQGFYKDHSAIIKIQGIRPTISEIYMIESFQENNKSKLIRPPHLYAYLPWNKNLRYEALVLEDKGDKKAINTPTNSSEIEEFFTIFREYRNNCLQNPWIERPEKPLSENIKENFDGWQTASFKLYPSHPLRSPDDKKLIDKAIEILTKEYKGIEPEFMHGHFSATDLYKVDNQIVLLSNLYWSYRAPFYDAIFAYHWFMYHLSSVEGISAEKINEQKKLWLDEIYALPKNDSEIKLLNLALLERAAAGLNLDALSINPNLEVSKYIVGITREDVKRLIKLLI
jgi:hypothetical protein